MKLDIKEYHSKTVHAKVEGLQMTFNGTSYAVNSNGLTLYLSISEINLITAFVQEATAAYHKGPEV